MRTIFPAVELILVDFCNDFDWNETLFSARLMSFSHAFSIPFFQCVLMPCCKLLKYPVENHWICYWIKGFVSNWHWQLLKCLQNHSDLPRGRWFQLFTLSLKCAIICGVSIWNSRKKKSETKKLQFIFHQVGDDDKRPQLFSHQIRRCLTPAQSSFAHRVAIKIKIKAQNQINANRLRITCFLSAAN